MGSVDLEGPRSVTAEESAEAAQMAAPQTLAGFLSRDAAIVYGLAGFGFLLHLAVNYFAAGRYSLFRDELYYIDCGEHLGWGYVDHAPLIAVVARLTRWLLGDSLVALRFFPALAAAATILLTAWMARELGGRGYGQGLAATAALAAPIYLVFDNLLTMNAFEPLFWMLCAAIALRILNRGDARLWLWFGLVAGIGLLNKHSMLFSGSGIFVGFLLTPERRFFRSKWIWLGGLIAFAIFLPNLVWEIRHGWPTIENLRNVRSLVNAPVTPLQFLWEQTLLVLPLSTPICLAGLYFLLRAKEGKLYRLLGWAYLVVLAELLVLKGKIYYLAPAYPMLFAAGAVWIEKWTEERSWKWLKPALMAALLVGAIVAAPLALPVLPPEATAKYAKLWNVAAVKVESSETGKLPQLFAEMFGWENQAAVIARVYHSLSPAEQAKCAILAGNFGEAGTIDFFGPRFGLPKAISGNNSYYLWGPREYSGEVVISFGVPRENLQALFGEIEQAATISHEYAVLDENNLPVYICRRPKMPLGAAWPRLRVYG